MSIPEGGEEDKIGHIASGRAGERRVIYGAILFLIATLCFGLGTLAARENPPTGDTFWIEQLPPEEFPGSISTSSSAGERGMAPASTEAKPGGGPAAAGAVSVPSVDASSGTYVASKNGTRYYLPSCGGVKRINEENKVWFATKSEAEAAGYTPAANCDGI